MRRLFYLRQTNASKKADRNDRLQHAQDIIAIGQQNCANQNLQLFSGSVEQHPTKTQRSADFQNSSLTKPFVGAKLILLIHQQ
jgi:hypothetical protein